LQFEKKMRPGLHVTLEMQLNMEADDVRKILEALKKEGLKGKTVRKKEKKKSMDLHA